jgi:DNA-binding NtrC family response regulator
MAKYRILAVDDEPGVLELWMAALREMENTEVVVEDRSRRAAELLEKNSFDLLISDLRMPELDGLELARRARNLDPNLPILIMTGCPTVETAVECMKLGVTDYVTKLCSPRDLFDRVRAMLESGKLREENRLLRRQMERAYCCGNLLGQSAVMRELCQLIQRTAETDFDVLIVGETGTGKELVAKAIHQRSRRKEAPFVPVNCGAIPEELMEREFFGHERGAFTGAQSRGLGLLEFAQRGTFFLDELNQLPSRLQGKLLRVLQERKIRRVGGTQEIDLDVRIVAASSVSIEAEVRNRRFRADLYHRIHVARIEVPPLRERAEDVPLLAKAFLERYARDLGREMPGISVEAMEVLSRYPWPGNVRELQNLLKRTLAWASGDTIEVDDFPDDVVARASESAGAGKGGFFALRERRLAAFERQYFQSLLAGHAGDVSAAARESQLPRGTLYRLLNKHGLNPADFRPAADACPSEPCLRG